MLICDDNKLEYDLVERLDDALLLSSFQAWRLVMLRLKDGNKTAKLAMLEHQLQRLQAIMLRRSTQSAAAL